MAPPDGLLVIGRTSRAHGLKGEITVTLTTNRTERLEPGSRLWCGDRPVEVLSSRPTARHHLVRFAGIDSRTEAEALEQLELRAAPLDDPDELWVHELIGARVVDSEGVDRGRVAHVEANPASDLLVLDSGALVPARFVDEVGDDVVRVTVPDGLFDL